MTPPPVPTPSTALGRLTSHWVYGGALAGFLLLLLAPVLLVGFPLPFALVVLQLPMYMLHQYEEHDDDRFRAFVNREIGGGRDVLPTGAVFVINIVGVWLLFAAAIWLSALAGIGFGLIAIYGVLVNALVHIVAALAMRRYNPGLATSILLFLPVGGAGLYAVATSAGVGLGFHLLGLALAVAVHLAIAGYVRRNRRHLL
ncbi:MAG: HXXEE domain-containing protein [Deinococcales bacterium]